MDDLYKKSARDIREAYAQGSMTAVAITEYFLKRQRALDTRTGAFLKMMAERALDIAKRLDAKRAAGDPLGKLAGVPIAVKDNIHIRGELTTCGSRFLSNYYAPFSSTVVELLEQEDALLIGKTNLDEFAMGSSNENSAYFPSKNPWNLSCVPGGSSGGSASAVAARFCPIGLGTDTGGSVRQPAAFCGIVGYKPTYGRVSRYGLVAFGSSLDQIGPMTTNVGDAALMMEVMGRHCPRDATSCTKAPESIVKKLKSDMNGVKIGVPWHFLEGLNKESKKVFDEAIDTCKELGAEIVDVDLDVLKYSISVYYIVATAEAATNLARFDGVRYGMRSKEAKTLQDVYELSKDEGFGQEVKNRILLGTYVLSGGYQDAYYKRAQKVRTLIIDGYRKAFETCDVVAMPTSPLPAFTIGEFHDPIQLYLQDIYTISANLAGLPAISIPSGFNSDKKPFGLQLIGPQLKDAALLSVAHAFEKGCRASNQVPPEFDQEVK